VFVAHSKTNSSVRRTLNDLFFLFFLWRTMTGCVQRLQLLNEVKRCSLNNNSWDDHICIQSTLTLLDWSLETESDRENIRIDINTAELAN
jgi:hypothetical protein